MKTEKDTISPEAQQEKQQTTQEPPGKILLERLEALSKKKLSEPERLRLYQEEIRSQLVQLYDPKAVTYDRVSFDLAVKAITRKLGVKADTVLGDMRSLCPEEEREHGSSQVVSLSLALEAMLTRSDKAKEAGGQGFNKLDADFAHTLGKKPQEQWRPDERHRLWSILSKYRKQLADMGIDWDAIPEPSRDGIIPYRETAHGSIVLVKFTEHGELEIPLCNFTAKITADVLEDDGVERKRCYEIVAQQRRREVTVSVPTERFARMEWAAEALGAKAIIEPGMHIKDHTRAAIQHLSEHITTKTVYLHVGWCKIGEQWVYLHGGGAIGKTGTVDGIEVALPDALKRYLLPDPPQGEDKVNAIRASLRILTVAPPRLTVPLLASPYCAVLGDTNFSLHYCGQTGKGKTALAALGQQHFGAGMDAEHLPASWGSTGNSLEVFAFAVKDALLVVDDFAPTGSTAEVQRSHREADRLLRAQGNRAGRGRLRSDATLRPVKPPRGLIFSTGEDLPRGQSLRARLEVIEVNPGDVDLTPPTDTKPLTLCQKDAAAGLYAQSLAAFVHWVAGQYDAIQDRVKKDRDSLRNRLAAEHARTNTIIAQLAAGYGIFLDFAMESGAITSEEREAHWQGGWQTFTEAAAVQAQHQAASDPVRRFIELIGSALVSGGAHVASRDGSKPEGATSWGWREREIGTGTYRRTEWQPQGMRIGWVEGENLYLEPDTAFAVAQKLSRDQGDSLATTQHTLQKRLKEHHALASWDEKRQRLTVRKTLEGREHAVLHLHVSIFAQDPTMSGKPSKLSKPSNDHKSPEKISEKPSSDRPDHPDRPDDRPDETQVKPTAYDATGRFGQLPVGEGTQRAVYENGATETGRLQDQPTVQSSEDNRPVGEEGGPDPVEVAERRAIQEEANSYLPDEEELL